MNLLCHVAECGCTFTTEKILAVHLVKMHGFNEDLAAKCAANIAKKESVIKVDFGSKKSLEQQLAGQKIDLLPQQLIIYELDFKHFQYLVTRGYITQTEQTNLERRFESRIESYASGKGWI